MNQCHGCAQDINHGLARVRRPGLSLMRSMMRQRCKRTSMSTRDMRLLGSSEFKVKIERWLQPIFRVFPLGCISGGTNMKIT